MQHSVTNYWSKRHLRRVLLRPWTIFAIIMTVYYKPNNIARSRNHCCRGKSLSVTYSECVSSLIYPACKSHASNCSLSDCTMLYTLSHKRYSFRGKKFAEHKMCLDFLYDSVWNISYSKKNSARYYHKCT
jgi:predicted metal-binding transcription factor (methanogenesis marker protein 9)